MFVRERLGWHGKGYGDRFIKVRGIPFVSGKGGPKGNRGTRKGKGRPGRRPKPVAVERPWVLHMMEPGLGRRTTTRTVNAGPEYCERS